MSDEKAVDPERGVAIRFIKYFDIVHAAELERMKKFTTPQIDAFTMPKMEFLDEPTAGLMGSIMFAIESLRSEGGVGPYGAIEQILSAIEDFANAREGRPTA